MQRRTGERRRRSSRPPPATRGGQEAPLRPPSPFLFLELRGGAPPTCRCRAGGLSAAAVSEKQWRRFQAVCLLFICLFVLISYPAARSWHLVCAGSPALGGGANYAYRVVLDLTLRLSTEIPPRASLVGFCSEGRSLSGMHISCIHVVVGNLGRTV